MIQEPDVKPRLQKNKPQIVTRNQARDVTAVHNRYGDVALSSDIPFELGTAKQSQNK